MIDDYLYKLVVSMQVHFNTNSPSNPSGQAGLTMLSMAVGAEVLGLGKHPTRTQMIDQVRVGDLFIEPFIKFGFVNLVRPMVKDGMYFIEVGDRWHEIGDAITITPTHHISQQPITDGCLIKGNESKSLQDAPWRRSATRLMSVPWRINTPVYEALRASKGMFVSEEPIEVVDDFTSLQEIRRRSKLMDYKITIREAEKFLGQDMYFNIEADYRVGSTTPSPS